MASAEAGSTAYEDVYLSCFFCCASPSCCSFLCSFLYLLLQAQRRRSTFQEASLAREKALDLLPLDMEHDLDNHLMKHFTDEAAHVSAAVGRLMASYSFLCHPFIPCSSLRSAITVMKIDNAKGKWYSLGDDVSALFYLPHPEARDPPRPKAALNRIMVGRCTSRRSARHYCTQQPR